MARNAVVSLLVFGLLALVPPGMAAAPAGMQGASAPLPNGAAIRSYLDGLDALADGNYAEAEKDLTKAIAADEESAVCYQARGVARTFAQDFDRALADFQRAQRLADSAGWETKGWIGVASKMNNHPEAGFAPGLAPRAELEYALALSDMSQSYWQSRNQGQYYDKATRQMVASAQPYTGDFAKVAGMYVQRHRALTGDAGRASLTRVQAKAGSGDNVGSLRKIERLVEANPGDVELLTTRAQLLLDLGDLAGAREVYTDVLTRKQSAAAYIGRAKAAARMGDAARANRDLGEAARLDANAAAGARKEFDSLLSANRAPAQADPQTLWRQLESQARNGASDAACREAAVALLRATGAVRIRYDERYQDRLATLETALQAKPNDPDRQVALARYLREQSDVLAEQIGPRDPPRYYRIQSDADKQHEIERAVGLVDAALRAHPKHLGALGLKAHMLILEDRYDDAQEIVTQALALKGDDPDLLEAMAGLLRIQAARRITEAGNLKSIKSWSEIDFNRDPPVEYTWWRMPSEAELQQAAELEKQANQLSAMAQERLAKAAASAGATATGYYYQGLLHHARGDEAAAKESMTQAVTLKPDFEEAWYDLSAICTHLMDSAGAMQARAMAYNLAQTTAQAELKALWYRIPHNQFKSAREATAEGLKRDPADPRLSAYLAVIDEATEKPDEAMVHYRMAKAISDAELEWHGTRFAPPAKGALPPSAQDAGFASAVRLRIGALLLDQGRAAEAAEEFAVVDAMLAAMPDSAAKAALWYAMLPPAESEAGVVPVAESIGTLQIRAAAGEAYAKWAAAGGEADVALAAKTYRRMLVNYQFRDEKLDSLKAIADLGLAELYFSRGQIDQASAAMRDTPAVPQAFWQEMRQTEAAIRSKQR